MYIMEGVVRVAKWGNSLAVRLPASVVDALDLKEGDDVELAFDQANKAKIIRQPSRQELIERLRAFRGRMPAGFSFDRDEANEGRP